MATNTIVILTKNIVIVTSKIVDLTSKIFYLRRQHYYLSCRSSQALVVCSRTVNLNWKPLVSSDARRRRFRGLPVEALHLPAEGLAVTPREFHYSASYVWLCYTNNTHRFSSPRQVRKTHTRHPRTPYTALSWHHGNRLQNECRFGVLLACCWWTLALSVKRPLSVNFLWTLSVNFLWTLSVNNLLLRWIRHANTNSLFDLSFWPVKGKCQKIVNPRCPIQYHYLETSSISKRQMTIEIVVSTNYIDKSTKLYW